MKLFAEQETEREIVEALQASSDRCGAGLAIALAAEKTSQLSSHPRHLMHAGCSRRQRLIGVLEGKQRLPLVLLKGNGTRCLRSLARKLLDVLDSPRHHQVNGETVLPNRAVSELTALNTADALDRPMILLDAPAPLVPVDLLQSLLEIVHLNGGQQHPLHSIFFRRRIHLSDIHRPHRKCSERRLELWGTQRHLSKANLKHRIARRSPLAPGNAEQALARHRLILHVWPKTGGGVFHAPIRLSSNQKLGVGGIAFRPRKQLVHIGFAVSDTD